MLWEKLGAFATTYHSQAGEDGILHRIFLDVKTVGVNRFLVDIGAGDGFNISNTRFFMESGWKGSLFDIGQHAGVHQERFDGDNAAKILHNYGVPEAFDLLSLDIDGQDFWVLQKILRNFQPSVIVAEINGSRPHYPAVTVPFYPPWEHDGSNYYGMSLGALEKLGKRFDYVLVYQHMALNGFLVHRRFIPTGVEPVITFHVSHGHRPDPLDRPWHEITDEDLIRP